MSTTPPGWMSTTLGELILGIEAGKSFQCEPRPARAGEWGVIKVSAMTWGAFQEDENKAVPAGVKVDPSLEIKTGDILISRANTEEYVGASVMVGNCRPLLLLSDKSLRIEPSEQVDRRWLFLLLTSPFVRRQVSTSATGVKHSMRNITQEKLSKVSVLVPPLSEQRRVVALLDEHLSRLDASVKAVQSALHQEKALRKTIFDYAFEGRLAPQDPGDEPASALLERIRREREAQPKPQRRRRTASVSQEEALL